MSLLSEYDDWVATPDAQSLLPSSAQPSESQPPASQPSAASLPAPSAADFAQPPPLSPPSLGVPHSPEPRRPHPHPPGTAASPPASAPVAAALPRGESDRGSLRSDEGEDAQRPSSPALPSPRQCIPSSSSVGGGGGRTKNRSGPLNRVSTALRPMSAIYARRRPRGLGVRFDEDRDGHSPKADGGSSAARGSAAVDPQPGDEGTPTGGQKQPAGGGGAAGEGGEARLLGKLGSGRSKWQVVQRSLKDIKEVERELRDMAENARGGGTAADEEGGGEGAEDDDLERLAKDLEALRAERKARQQQQKQQRASNPMAHAGGGLGAQSAVAVDMPGVARQRKMVRQSVIMCMDPMCNRCPPEMHLHMRKMMSGATAMSSAAVAPAVKDYSAMDWMLDDDEGDQGDGEEELLVTLRCCGLKITYRRRRFTLRRWLSELWPPPVLNPHNFYVKLWIKLQFGMMLLAFLLDPLFLLVLSISQENMCVYTRWTFGYCLVGIRTFIDVFTLLNMLVHTRLAFNATHEHVRAGSILNAAGEAVKLGELVITDERAILLNYLHSLALWDLLALLPIPQVVTLVLLPISPDVNVSQTWQVAARLSILLQFVPRMARMYPMLSGQGSHSFLFETAWASFLLNLVAFFMGSNVVGSLWYLLTMQRAATCLVNACLPDADPPCQQAFLSCWGSGNPPGVGGYSAWVTNSTGVYDECLNNGAISSDFYGMYTTGVRVVQLGSWFSTWLYSLMWGFQQISTLAGNLVPSTEVGEVVFMLLIVALGLFLFAFLIGNMQNFLQSLSRRSFEHRLHLRDLEQWMSQRDIPRDLQRRVRQLERYVWTVNQGVNEEEVMTSLSEDIQRDVRRHLSLELITKHCVLLKGMPEQVLDAICERLKQRLYIDGTIILREGSPVSRMFFVLRGALESSTTNRGRTGFYEEVILGKGDFVGEELLVYFIEKYAEESNKKHKLHSRRSMRRDMKVGSAVMPDLLPKSERTFCCIGPVEGFSLEAADIDFVCTQFFTVMQSDQVQQALNMCSLNRRMRAATTIQVWYRSVLRRRLNLPIDVMRQAIRTKRIGALLRSLRSQASGEGGSGTHPRGGEGGSLKGSEQGSAEHGPGRGKQASPDLKSGSSKGRASSEGRVDKEKGSTKRGKVYRALKSLGGGNKAVQTPGSFISSEGEDEEGGEKKETTADEEGGNRVKEGSGEDGPGNSNGGEGNSREEAGM
ncbi:hypothetical protein CLOM_g12453 [Closterium sp. NIES-68]|nr:hypothetical protein CLOM_g12453 [Closterium sp. NIES-68]GJP72521.1 hypothetical protein CLOP_g3249 [Closterium sp. NIES-67]